MGRRLMVLLALTVVTVWSAVLVLPDKKLHVVFCDVGQGDATLLTWGRVQVLVDGGPSEDVLTCLEKHVPFFDKRIEMIILTHPQADHMNGLVSVVKRYDLMYFVKGKEGAKGSKYQELMKVLSEKKVEVLELFAGEKMVWEDGGQVLELEIVWPTEEFATNVGENVDVNQLSRVSRVKFGDFEVLLPGDADKPVQEEQLATGRFKEVEVLKVPHHGSRTGMRLDWLSSLSPELAVISVGKNSYGHPGEETIQMLIQAGAEVRRTDLGGDVEVVSDGKMWVVR